MTSKKTRQALVSSVISLVLCCSMLIGTTFAWFTDEVTSTNNIIKSGTLDITMEWANGKDDPKAEETTWTDASTGAIFDNDLWEPGYTEARHLRIANIGTLALNWSLAIVPTGEVSELAEVIDVYYYDYRGYGGNKQITDRDNLTGLIYKGTLAEWLNTGIVSGSLDANPDNPKTYALTVVLKMREEAGNEYQGKSIGSDFAVKLLATQKAKEPDSFDNTYDKFAGKTVVTPETAQAAIWAAQEGDVIYLDQGTYGTLVIENEDGSPKKGLTIEHDKPGVNPTSAPFSVGHINLNGSEDVTIKGIYFLIPGAQPVYNEKTPGVIKYYASITGAKAGGDVGARNIVINDCKFDTTGSYSATTEINYSNYTPIGFEEQGRSTSYATDITITGCYVDEPVINYVRLNYMAPGTITIQNNQFVGGATHNALNFTGNSADLFVRGNSFGWDAPFGDTNDENGWNPANAMLGSSWQAGKVQIEVTGNSIFFRNDSALEESGSIIGLKSSYTADNCEIVFEKNNFQGGLAGMTEETAPCLVP